MKRYMGPILAMLLLVGWIHLLSVPTAAQSGYVEVTFRCPLTNGILAFDWRSPLGTEYTEDGKQHDLKFRRSSGTVAPAIYNTGGPKRSGESIRCEYHSASSTPPLHAVYLYDVHREIISCASGVGTLICKLKP